MKNRKKRSEPTSVQFLKKKKERFSATKSTLNYRIFKTVYFLTNDTKYGKMFLRCGTLANGTHSIAMRHLIFSYV